MRPAEDDAPPRLRVMLMAPVTVAGPPDAQSITRSAISPAGEIGDGFKQIVLLDAEDVIGAEFLRQLEAALVGGV